MSVGRQIIVGGRAVGSVGYGMLGLGIPWMPVERGQAIKLLKTALENGANLWNGSTHYGTPDSNSTHLIRDYFKQYPEDAAKVVLTLKGAFDHQNGPDGSPEGIRASVETAYNILKGIKSIDTFGMGRVDPKVPIETSIQILAELVKEGKIGGIGVSEVSASTICRAQAIHPISVAEIELSLFTPDPLRNGIVDACHEFSIPIIAYSPIGRGMLSGGIKTLDNLATDDFRRRLPRFQEEALKQNLKLVDAVEKIAKHKQVTTAQIALGWVVAKGAIPIPGTKTIHRVEENCRPADLNEKDIAELDNIVNAIPVSGERYGGVQETFLNA